MVQVGSARVGPYGSLGMLVDLGIAEHPARAILTQAAIRALSREFPRREIVSGAGTIGVFGGVGDAQELDVLSIERALAADHGEAVPGRVHEIPVVYDGPDLEPLAAQLGLSSLELIELHTSQELFCELLGFMPGFGYLGPNPHHLVVPRRPSPRARVPAGSVALARAYSGIYPFESPGGWHLLGRSLGAPLFDPARPEPSLLKAGDRVRFMSVSADQGTRSGRVLDIRLSLSAGSRPGLVVLDAPPLTTLQDEGRVGGLAQGVPASGPLAPSLRSSAERALGNPSRAATLEIVGGAARFRAQGALWIALDGAEPRALKDGELLEVPAGPGWVRYLALEGGFEADLRLGSRSTLLTAGFGGYGGRAVRRGDFLARAEPVDRAREAKGASPGEGDGPDSERELIIEPGPHAEHFADNAFERFLGSEYRVSPLSNRIGKRLEGPKVERRSTDTLLPTPMVRGAIEVPASGEPIVLGPDHPTTGGYPVLAVVCPESWDRFGALRPGQKVRFSRR